MGSKDLTFYFTFEAKQSEIEAVRRWLRLHESTGIYLNDVDILEILQRAFSLETKHKERLL